MDVDDARWARAAAAERGDEAAVATAAATAVAGRAGSVVLSIDSQHAAVASSTVSQSSSAASGGDGGGGAAAAATRGAGGGGGGGGGKSVGGSGGTADSNPFARTQEYGFSSTPRSAAAAGLPADARSSGSGGGVCGRTTGDGSPDVKEAAAREQLRSYVRDLRMRVEVIRPWELQVVRLLGAGAFGSVYLARWRSTEVAVKCLSPSLLVADGSTSGAQSTAAVADLMRETGILAGLRHPNVVAVFGAVLPECATEGEVDSGPHLSSALFTRGAGAGGPPIRPPALVCEYLAHGSLRAAINARADFLAAPQAKLKLLLDTARVGVNL